MEVKSWLIRKDRDAGRDWRQEKGTTEDEVVGWHHQLNECELEQTRRWWRTGRPGALWPMGLRRVRQDQATEQQQQQVQKNLKRLYIYTVLTLSCFSCVWLCDPMDCNPPGSFVHGILQARILEWIAIPFSRGSSWPRDQARVSCIAGRCFTPEPPGKPYIYINITINI